MRSWEAGIGDWGFGIRDESSSLKAARVMFDQGTGPPLIVIPGIQGRWEWLRPALRELRKHTRTVSYTLCGDFGSGVPFDPSLGFDNYVRQLDAVFLKAGIESAALCGVSYGGFIALRYAAMRPGRVTALDPRVVARSGVGAERTAAVVPGASIDVSSRASSRPHRCGCGLKCGPHTIPGRSGWRSRCSMPARVIAAPMIPSRMAARVTLQQALDFAPDCARIRVPTLVITGDDALDQVVPPAVSRRYLDLIPGAQYEKMERTGHIGMVTRPKHFADVVTRFLESNPDQN